MKEVKLAEFDNGLLFQANVSEGELVDMEVSLKGSRKSKEGPLKRTEVQALSAWLVGLLGKTQAVVQVMANKNQLELPLENRTAKGPNPNRDVMSGVEVFDRSSELPKNNAVKFKIPPSK